MEPASAFLAQHEDAIHRRVRNHAQGHCILHRARRWTDCDWCCNLHNETLLALAKKLRAGLPDDPGFWLNVVIDSAVADAVRSLRGQMGVGTRPERHPGWLEALLDGNHRDLQVVEQVRWWAGPQPVAAENTLIPYAYLAARLGEPNSPELRGHITLILARIEEARPDWYYQNVGLSLHERRTGPLSVEPSKDPGIDETAVFVALGDLIEFEVAA